MTRSIVLRPSTIDVWIVEDRSNFRHALVRLLEEVSDLRCTGAFATCEAMQNALATTTVENTPDVALMDIELRDGQGKVLMNGIEGIALLKSRLPQVGIVMLTQYDDAERIFSALRAGASGYLDKASSVDMVVEAIREVHRGGLPFSPPVARKVRTFFTGPQIDYGLSSRELEILQCMERGAKIKEVAEKLYLSPHTIDSHLRNIYQKLHVHSGMEAVAKAIREHLI